MDASISPHWAILAGGVVGILAIFSDSFIVIGGLPLTANIVTMSVFGAIVMYIISMAACSSCAVASPNWNDPSLRPVPLRSPALAFETGGALPGRHGLLQHYAGDDLRRADAGWLCLLPSDSRCRGHGL